VQIGQMQQQHESTDSFPAPPPERRPPRRGSVHLT
jgi:hypothetical protein